MRGGLTGEFFKAWGICRSDVERNAGNRHLPRSRRSSASTSSNRLFLGGLVSTRACLRFTGQHQNAIN